MIGGSNFAIVIEKQKRVKTYFDYCRLYPGSTVIEHLTNDPNFEGSYPANVNAREKMLGKYLTSVGSASVTQW
jgi:hypothetical protein